MTVTRNGKEAIEKHLYAHYVLNIDWRKGQIIVERAVEIYGVFDIYGQIVKPFLSMKINRFFEKKCHAKMFPQI